MAKIVLKRNSAISDGKIVMDNFMRRLANDEFKKDVEPVINSGFQMTKEAIQSKINSFNSLLNSGIIEKAIDDDTSSLKKCLGSMHKK